jgi:hypothetical protein
MKLLIQNNLLSDRFLNRMRAIASKYPSVLADIIPFDSDFTTSEELDGIDYIPYGSTSMTEICYKRGYSGVCFNENFKHSVYAKNHPMSLHKNVFNTNDAIDFLSTNESDWFIKPDNDDKNFTGFVSNSIHLVAFLKDKLRYSDSNGSYGINIDTKFAISKPVNIQMETRWFIVDGKIVDGSNYMVRGQKHSENVSNNIDMVNEAQSIADIWLPHRNVVMDLFLIDDVLYVGEFNCINSSGFYDHDVERIFNVFFNSFN